MGELVCDLPRENALECSLHTSEIDVAIVNLFLALSEGDLLPQPSSAMEAQLTLENKADPLLHYFNSHQNQLSRDMNPPCPIRALDMRLPRLMLLLLFLAVSTTRMRASDALVVSMTAQPPYCVNFKCAVKSSRRAEFLSLIAHNQRMTLQNEPDALQYTFGEDVSDLNTFYLHEQFTSPEGFVAHRHTRHNAEWQRFRNSDPFVEGGEPVVNFYYGTHEPEKVPVRDAFCLNVQLCIDPEVRDEFMKVIEENARGSNQDEPLCLQYAWGEDINESNTFHFHEQYSGKNGGKEGFDAHAATKHFGQWEAFAAKDPFTKPPIVSFYKTLPQSAS